MGHSDDTPLARASVIAREQLRSVTTAQLRACGFSPTMIKGARRRGVLSRAYPSVYLLGPPPSSPYERAMAAVLAAGPTGLLSHDWCRWLFRVGRLPDHPPDVTVTRHRAIPGITIHRTRIPPEPDANHGILCTRPERMIIDCAPSMSLIALRRLVNDVQIRRLTTAERIRRAAAAHPGRMTKSVAALVADDRGATRSLLEDLLDELHRTQSLPLPLVNHRLHGHEVDFAYPDRHLVIEADGWEFHRTRQQFEDDRA
jgi:hypothetical protein